MKRHAAQGHESENKARTVAISPVSLSRSRSKNDCSSSGFNMFPSEKPLSQNCARELVAIAEIVVVAV